MTDQWSNGKCDLHIYSSTPLQWILTQPFGLKRIFTSSQSKIEQSTHIMTFICFTIMRCLWEFFFLVSVIIG